MNPKALRPKSPPPGGGGGTPATPTLDRSHIRPGDRICAAVSGGADSVALLRLLHAANSLPRNSLGVGLSAIHIHHGIRGPEADADLAFVQSLCDSLQVPLHIRHVDTPAYATLHRQTTEEAARNLRYHAFQQLIAEGLADSILTAHTLDDQAETVLMKLLRGAWTEGLSGIHPILPLKPTGSILRPLLETRRADLRVWLESLPQPWREDSSNSDEAFTRNRIRHIVLPILREENPSIDHTLANLAILAREDEAHWTAELARILPQLLLPGKPVRGGGRAVPTIPGDPTVAVDLDRLRPLTPAARRRVLRAAARTLGAPLTFDETTRLLTLAGLGPSPPPAGATLHLSHNLHAERSPRELRLRRKPPAP